MKSRILLQLITSFMMGIFVISCAENDDKSNPVNNLAEGIPVSVRFAPQALPTGMECDMYIFCKENGASTDYVLKEIIPFGNEDRKTIKYNNGELVNNTYRFLFVAAPVGYTQIKVKNAGGVDLSVGDTWGNVRMVADNPVLSDQFYYQALTKTGNEIVSQGTIQALLTRLVGRMAIDIYHIDGNGDPDTVRTSTVASVLDRVKQIKLEYKGLTKELSFDAQGNVVESARFTGSYTDSLDLVLENTTFQVKVENQDNQKITVSGNGKPGSVRINGFYCLPSTDSIRLQAKFVYYDTTPTCGNNHTGTPHVATCYKQDTLVLNLPEETETTLLSVKPNHITVNKAGIKLDRIIDVLATGGFRFNTEWDNQME